MAMSGTVAESGTSSGSSSTLGTVTPTAASPSTSSLGDVEATPASSSCVIGIDFGRTKCEAAVVDDDGIVVMIPLDGKDAETADCFSLSSCVTVGTSTPLAWTVGLHADKRVKSGDPNTFYDLTELLGRKVDALQPRDVARWVFPVRSGVNEKAVLTCPSLGRDGTTAVYPEQVAAMLLSTIKRRAQSFTDKRVAGAVVCVPAAFNHTQRQALRDACTIARLPVERLVVASTATAVAQASEVLAVTGDGGSSAAQQEKKVVVVDFGAGSFDVTLARVRGSCGLGGDGDDGEVEVRVVATAGDLKVGGEHFTDRLVDHFGRLLEQQTPRLSADTTNPAFARQLRRACVLAKKILSTSHTTTINLHDPQVERSPHAMATLPGDALGLDTPRGFTSSVTRAEFEDLCGSETWTRVLGLLEQVLHLAQVNKSSVDALLLCGGSMRVPKVRALVHEFAASTIASITHIPAHSAAMGAALIATSLRKCVLLEEPTPLALGVRNLSGDALELIPQATPVPTQQSRLYFASCHHEVVFDVLEGTLGPRRQSLAVADHTLGRVRLDGSRTSKHLILKLEVVFSLDSAQHLTVTVMEHTSGRMTTMHVDGDETCLSAEALVLATAQFDTATTSAGVSDSSRTASPLPQLQGANRRSSPEALREYVTALQPMVQTNRLSVCVSPGDLLEIRTKVERAVAWLDELQQSLHDEHDAESETPASQRQLHQLRMLHLSSVASNALALLRQQLTPTDEGGDA